MEKVITVSLEKAAFLRSVFDMTIKAQDEESLITKMEFYKSLKPTREKIKALISERAEVAKKVESIVTPKERAEEMEKFEKFEKDALAKDIEITMSSELLDWTKGKWKLVPSLFKLVDHRTGAISQEGLSSEEDCELYYGIKMAIEDARVKKEEEPKKSDKK